MILTPDRREASHTYRLWGALLDGDRPQQEKKRLA